MHRLLFVLVSVVLVGCGPPTCEEARAAGVEAGHRLGTREVPKRFEDQAQCYLEGYDAGAYSEVG